jgi:hypothetical protein
MPRSKEKGKKTKLQPVKEKEVLQKKTTPNSKIVEADQYRGSIFVILLGFTYLFNL